MSQTIICERCQIPNTSDKMGRGSGLVCDACLDAEEAANREDKRAIQEATKMLTPFRPATAEGIIAGIRNSADMRDGLPRLLNILGGVDQLAVRLDFQVRQAEALNPGSKVVLDFHLAMLKLRMELTKMDLQVERDDALRSLPEMMAEYQKMRELSEPRALRSNKADDHVDQRPNEEVGSVDSEANGGGSVPLPPPGG